MLEATKVAIKTVLSLDPIATEESRKRILGALDPRIKRPAKKLITTEQAAKLLDVCTFTLRRYAKRGLLHPVRHTARRIRWDRIEIERFRDHGVTA